MAQFELPEAPDLPEPPPPDPMAAREEKIANDTRVESEINRFLAARQDALFHAPDAFYRTEGEDAIHAAPETSRKLDALRRDLIDRAANDYQRGRLGAALGAQMELTRDGMARHVAEQSLAWQRQVAQDRIALLTKEAALHHSDDALIDTLGHAAATAARAHARVGIPSTSLRAGGPPAGETEDTAAATARSGVLGAAIQARLDRGDADGAKVLLTRVQDQLDPEHATPINDQIAQADSSSVKDDATTDPESGVELAQASTAGPAKSKPAGPARRPSTITPPQKEPLTEEERNRRSIAAHQELNGIAAAPRNPKVDTKDPLPADWERRLPKATLTALDAAAMRFGVPRRLLAAVIWQESEFKEDAGQGTRAQGQGIAGVSEEAKNELIRRANLRRDGARVSELQSFNRMRASDSVNMAAEYLRMIYDENHQSWPAAVAGYKQSPPEVYGWLRGTGMKIKEDPNKWRKLVPYVRQIFQGDPAAFDTKISPDVP